MLSIETERDLAEIFIKISDLEKTVEEFRCYLCKNQDFDPYNVYNFLSVTETELVSSREVQSLLENHRIFCSEDESYLLVRQYDSNADGKLPTEDLFKLILPSTNPGLKDLALSRRGKFTTEVEYLLVRLLESEVAYHRTLETLKRNILSKSDFNLLEAFRTIDYKNLSYIDRGSLSYFLKKYRNTTDQDIDPILRRVDNDGDEVISYLEFVEFIMPSRLAVANRSGSPFKSPARHWNSSPLRNQSQFSFMNSPAQSHSPPQKLSSVLTDSNKYSIKHSSPLKSSPLRKSNNYPKDKFESAYSPTKSTPLRSSHLEYFANPARDSILHKSSPLKPSNYPEKLSNTSINSKKTSDFGYRKSSPLRSPLRSFEPDYKNPSKSLSYKNENIDYYKNPRLYDQKPPEAELIAYFQEEIRMFREIESNKNELASKNDFNLIDAFRIFDLKDLGNITASNIEETLRQFSIYGYNQEIYLLIKHYSRLKDDKLRFADFSEIFMPREEDYSRVLRNRRSSNLSFNDRMKAFSGSTLDLLLYTLKGILESEGVIERLRQKLSSMPDLSVYQAFNYIDKDRDGFITIHELQSILETYGLFPSPKDLQVLMYKYDKNKDGRVSYTEFLEELTPKSPNRYKNS